MWWCTVWFVGFLKYFCWSVLSAASDGISCGQRRSRDVNLNVFLEWRGTKTASSFDQTLASNLLTLALKEADDLCHYSLLTKQEPILKFSAHFCHGQSQYLWGKPRLSQSYKKQLKRNFQWNCSNFSNSHDFYFNASFISDIRTSFIILCLCVFLN